MWPRSNTAAPPVSSLDNSLSLFEYMNVDCEYRMTVVSSVSENRYTSTLMNVSVCSCRALSLNKQSSVLKSAVFMDTSQQLPEGLLWRSWSPEDEPCWLFIWHHHHEVDLLHETSDIHSLLRMNRISPPCI